MQTISESINALHTYIDNAPTEALLMPLIEPKSRTYDARAIGKLLLNSLSAEYALRITPVVNDEQYLQSSLHWTFPQAYYSILFSARAFLAVHNEPTSNEDKIRLAIAQLVQRHEYPVCLSFYVWGYSTSGFGNHFGHSRNDHLADSMVDTRKAQLLKILPGEHVGVTTFFDILNRLRISSNSRETEAINLPTFDVRRLHDQLLEIVNYVNGFHELQVINAIGKLAYCELINALPSYLRDIPRKRYDDVLRYSLDSAQLIEV